MKFSVDKVKKALFLNEDEISQLSDREKENIKKDAESKGLVSLGFGNYGKEKGAEASHKVKDGKLISISDDDGDNKEPQVKTQDREPPQAASDSEDDVIGTAVGGDTENNNSEIQSRIEDNRERIQKFREARDKFAAKGDDGMMEYEDYLVDQIKNNEEIIGDALDEILDIEDSFDEKNPIVNFTGQDYDGTGHRLSMISLAARYPDGNTSDFRVERMKKRCEEGDPKYKSDCENYSPNDTPTEKDIEAFKKLQKNQQQSLVDMGLVDEDGMVTVYRGAGGVEGEGSVDYKGSAVDSWSMSPTIAWSYAEVNGGKNIMKVKVPLDRVIMAAAASTREQFEFPSEFEVTIDSIGLDSVESINYDSDKKKIMENTMAKTKTRIIKKNGKYKIIKENKGVPVDINNDKDTDWLRSNRKEQEQVEENTLEEKDSSEWEKLSDDQKSDIIDKEKKSGRKHNGKGSFGPKAGGGSTHKYSDGNVNPIAKNTSTDAKKKDQAAQTDTDAASDSTDDILNTLSGDDGDDANLDDSPAERDGAGSKINLPDSIKNSDSSIARALHYGFKTIKKGKDVVWKPAPGNPASLFNETVSMIGADLVLESRRNGDDMSEERLLKELDNRLSKTAAWKDSKVKDHHKELTVKAAITKADMIEEAMQKAGIDPKNSEVGHYYGSAVSLRNQYKEIMNHSGPFYGGDGNEIKKIPTDVETKMFLEDFKDPRTKKNLSEQEIENMMKNPTDPEVIKRFIALSAFNGGGGGNPSDTATIIKDGDKLQFLAYSDKTSLGDQQANSTPNKLLSNFFGTMRILKGEGYEFDPKQEEEMGRVIKDQGKKFSDAEKNLAAAIAAPFDVLGKYVGQGDEQVKDIFDKVFSSEKRKKFIQDQIKKIPDGPVSSKPQMEAMKDQGIDPPPSWDYYLNKVGWDGKSEPTEEQKIASWISRAGDTREFEVEDKDGNVETKTIGGELTSSQGVSYVGEVIKGVRNAHRDSDNDFELKGDDATSVIDQQRQIEKYRQESLKSLHDMHQKLNEYKIDKGGEDAGFGDVLMARDMARSLHLGMIDDQHAPGLFAFGSVHIVAGEHKTSPKSMRECLGGENDVDDLTRKIQTRLPEKSGPKLKNGLHESEVSRSASEKVLDDEGKNLYVVDGKYSFHSEKPSGENVKGPLGVITGRKVFAYVFDKEGNEINVGEMQMRTKGGSNLQTTYTFARSLQKCLEGKSGSTNEQVEIPPYLQRILDRL